MSQRVGVFVNDKKKQFWEKKLFFVILKFELYS